MPIGLKEQMPVLYKLEKARGTSPKGHARSHYFYLYGDEKYDFKIDSEKYSAQKIVEQLKKIIDEDKKTLILF